LRQNNLHDHLAGAPVVRQRRPAALSLSIFKFVMEMALAFIRRLA